MHHAALHTERLLLRPPEPRDAEGAVAFFLSPRADHAGRQETQPAAWMAFAGHLGHWQMRGWGLFAIEDKASGHCIGMAGPFEPGGRPEQELGWILWPEAEGRGLAFEAVSAARRHVFGALGWVTAVSYIDSRNHRSIRLAERLGAMRDDAAPKAPRPAHAGGECLVYRHPAPGGGA